MPESLSSIVIDTFSLNKNQDSAARELSRDVVVTAGAGSGKTRTLVARYAGLLAQGIPPRKIAAITFTTKAAMQMRSKVRESLATLEQQAADPAERQRWGSLSAQIDSARIGTIHSLCAEILRNHPAEAGLDPRFEVLDEGIAAVLKNQAVEDTLNLLVEDERFIPLFANIAINNLVQLLKELLGKRYEAQEIFELRIDSRAFLSQELKNRMNHPAIVGLIKELADMGYSALEHLAGAPFADMVLDLLDQWSKASLALVENDPATAALHLFQARRSCLRRNLGKACYAKESIAELQELFDLHINHLTGGKGSQDPPPSLESEQLLETLLPLLREAFTLVHQAYRESVQNRDALDFDDLEYGTYQLLKDPVIRAHWQNQLDAVMVDEYQDTNQYQRDIVNALAGERGCLFIVGDMRQSIYRFRRADVTVFREEQHRIEADDGLKVELDLTYGQHEPLLQTLADVLGSVIKHEQIPPPEYFVPFTPMVAHTPTPPGHLQSPHMEFVFGAGADADAARPVSARALAVRLLELKSEGQIQKWDDVALLFRAATGFPHYEEAFEEAGIPFVTVAGRGFYDRPEIRDLVNILRALATPSDDLAMAGLLRSPAFGLSDAALFQLRAGKTPFKTALEGDLSHLTAQDQALTTRCNQILSKLLPLVDRIPVAELLKRTIDALDYRAILATADTKSSGKTARAAGGRLWRNVDKLLEDTQTSQAATVRDFLEILSTLDDAGAREGEAPAEADGSVRLMTIHKSKGLEYPVVVLADAGRLMRSNSELVYLSKDLGVTVKLDPAPMLYSIAKHRDQDQEECEALRVLYVALTRAQNKLIISAHACIGKEGDKLRLDGWAKSLNEAANNPLGKCLTCPSEAAYHSTHSGYPLRSIFVKSTPVFDEAAAQNTPGEAASSSHPVPLYLSLQPADLENHPDEDRLTEIRSWRVFQPDREVHGKPLGKLVHKALQRWLFPGDPGLIPLLETESFTQGLVSDFQRQDAIDRACNLLDRFRHHPLWGQTNAAHERYSELPYSVLVGGKTFSFVIDLLYKDSKGWHLVDFKSDHIQSLVQKEKLVSLYSKQIAAYRQAVQNHLDQPVTASLCFLDAQGEVDLVEV